MADETKQTVGDQPREESGTQKLPLVFISHDTRDAQLAEAFSRLLGSVSCGVLKSFRSSDKKGKQGIDYGVEWYPEIISRLDQASDVVCLLTPNSVNRPWILYEAGIAKGKRETPVYGVALGIPLGDAGTGPFAQFQNCGDDNDSLTSLVIQLLRRVPNAEPDRDIVLAQVQSFKEIAKTLTKRPDTEQKKTPGPVDESSTAKLFEEVKVMFKDLPSRVEGRLLESLSPPQERRRRRVQPLAFRDLMHGIPGADDPVALLVAASSFRDELPWLYDLTVEACRAIRTGTAQEISLLIESLGYIDAWLRSGLFSQERLESQEAIMVIHEFPSMLRHRLAKALEARGYGGKQDTGHQTARRRE